MTFVLLAITVIACGKDNDSNSNSSLPSLPPMTDPNDVCTAMDDLKFMEYCYKHFDVNKDGKVSPSEANAVLEINVQGLGIHSLRGIEYFQNLKILDCSNNQLISLNVGRNTKLELLVCSGNQLTSLNVSRNTALTSLYCMWNELSATALNNLFESLHSNNPPSGKTVHIWGNPGTDTCNRSIATNKGWQVFLQW